MPITPGSAAKMNPVIGLSTVLSLTTMDLADAAKMTKILKKGIVVSFPNGTVALTDGVTALSDLSPIIDQVLTPEEKIALQKTFSGTGKTYQAVEGGLLVLGEDGRMEVASLPKSIWDSGSGKLLVSALPDSVRAGVSVVSDYTGLLAATDEQKRGLILVVDASGDETVDKGAALYQWMSDKNAFLKISEVESLDIDIAALRPNYQNVQAAGAVMYDHSLMIEPPSLTDMVALLEASLNNPGQPVETASYMEVLGSGGYFTFRIENETSIVAYWNTTGGPNATFINAGKPAFKLVMGPSADGMHYFYATGQGATSGDVIAWQEIKSVSTSASTNIDKLSIAANTALTVDDPRKLLIAPSANWLQVSLPNGATLSQDGDTFRIANIGIYPLTITDCKNRVFGSGMGILPPNTAREFSIVDRSTDTWVASAITTIATSAGDTDLTLTAHQATIFKSAAIVNPIVVPLSSTKSLVIFCDTGNASKGSMVVLNAVNGVCTVGPVTSISANALSTFTGSIAATKLSSDKVLVAYCDSTNSRYGTAALLSITNDTVTVLSTKVFVSAMTTHIDIVTLTPTTAAVVYRNDGNGSAICGEIVLLTVSGSTISSSAATKFSTTASAFHCIARISDTQCLIAFRDDANGNYAKVCCVTITAASAAIVTSKVIFEKDTTWTGLTRLTNEKFLFVFRVTDPAKSADENYRGYGIVIRIDSALDINIGVPTIISRMKTVFTGVTSLTEDLAVVAYSNTTTGNCAAKLLKIDGLAISDGEEVILGNASNYNAIRMLDQANAITVYADSKNGNYGVAQIISKI